MRTGTALKVPNCLVLIPDGNHRSAEAHRRPDIRAHHYGRKNAHVIIDAALGRGIPNVVFWGASYGNLRDRPALEVREILRLFKKEVKHRLEKAEEGRFYVCGRWRDFTNDIELFDMVEALEQRTRDYTGPSIKKLTVLFGYDGRDDLVFAVRRIIEAGLKPEEVTGENLPLYLMSAHVPSIDLVIRTGEEDGKPHWSKALLPWQMCDPELYFTPTFWPDLTIAELDGAIASWRVRRKLNGKK